MTRPNDFTLNTDYLSLAQSGRTTHSITTASALLNPGDETHQDFDLPISALPGSTHRTMIKFDDNNEYWPCNYINWENSGDGYIMYSDCSLSQINSSTIRLTYSVRLDPSSATSIQLPPITLTIRITSFRPPNVL